MTVLQLRRVLAVLCLLAAGAVGVWFLLHDARPGPSTVRLRDARRLCRQYANHEQLAKDLIAWSSTTAGAVTAVADQHRIDVAPWDRYPADHVLARCIFGDRLIRVGPVTPTSVCPNGRVVHRPDLEQVMVLVDEHGGSSPDRLARIVEAKDPLRLCG